MMLRWKSDGPRQTARFIGVIWFSSTKDVTSRRKKSSVCRTSLFSSGMSKMAALTACSLCSLGTSDEENEEMMLYYLLFCMTCNDLRLNKTINTSQTLTLVNMEEGFPQFAGQQGLR